MKNQLIILLLALLLCFSCKSDKESFARFDNYSVRDLDDIKKDGKLRALIAYSGTSYFLYKGKAMGYEFELLQKLADHYNLDLEYNK